MVYLSDYQVCTFLPPARVMSIVTTLLTQQTLFSGLFAEDTLGNVNLAVKGGYVNGVGYGVKVRTGKEGCYTTLLWNTQNEFLGACDTSSLTYLRTAALLLVWPYVTHFPVQRALVVGTGKLGTACIALLHTLYPHAQLAIWSPSQHIAPSSWLSDSLKKQLQWWNPTHDQEDRFDVILTCTRSSRPLSVLHHVSYHYVGVGGAVNNKRSEVPSHWLTQEAYVCADAPARAKVTCGDLLNHPSQEVLPLHECVRTFAPLPQGAVCFICGSGAIDVGLALCVLKQTYASNGSVLSWEAYR